MSGTVFSGGLSFRFVLSSKGGGETQIELDIGTEDLRTLLKSLASEDLNLADTFAECTQIAVAALLPQNQPR